MLLGGGHPLQTRDPSAAGGRRGECLRCVRFYRFVLSGMGAEQLRGGPARQPDL